MTQNMHLLPIHQIPYQQVKEVKVLTYKCKTRNLSLNLQLLNIQNFYKKELEKIKNNLIYHQI